MNNKDAETSANELEKLKDKYSRLERAYNALKDDAAENQGRTRSSPIIGDTVFDENKKI
ncbi:hypothetical protein [Desulfosporosinus sp. SB140]|uniref:hypothetical protein n=1 Tax=Desulfosporosinus paludis TaxID=3115649 RepID=UPI00388F9C52